MKNGIRTTINVRQDTDTKLVHLSEKYQKNKDKVIKSYLEKIPLHSLTCQFPIMLFNCINEICCLGL